MSVPVRVQGFDPDGREWQEMTATDDASYGGASFSLKHAHSVGQVVLLSLPLPSNFRRYSLAETSYKHLCPHSWRARTRPRGRAGGRDVPGPHAAPGASRRTPAGATSCRVTRSRSPSSTESAAATSDWRCS